MISNVKIRTAELRFSLSGDRTHPIQLTGVAYYVTQNGSVNEDRTYQIAECWTLALAQKMMTALQEYMPSTTMLDWDY